MRKILTLLLFALMATMTLPAAAAQSTASPSYFERVVLTDPEGDYTGNEALDLVNVYAHERFRYDFEKRQAIGDSLFFRIEPAGLDQLPSQVTARFHVHADANGTSHDLWVEVSLNNQQGTVEVTGSSPGVSGDTNSTSVFLTVPYETLGVAVGSVLTSVWAATSTAGGDTRVWHDVAPMDNGGVLVGPTEPTAPDGAAIVAVLGPYPFVTTVPKSPLAQPSAEGAGVKYTFEAVPAPGLSGEIVRYFFDIPAGWEVDPSRGSSGASPVGEITGLASPNSISFDVTVAATGFPPLGTEAVVTMEMVSASGAHQVFDLVTTVTGPKLNSSEYAFDMLSPASVDAGDTTELEFRVQLANGSALPGGLAVKVDMMQGGEIVDTVPTNSTGNGTYVAEYAFPSEGQWTADVYISNLRPSPHQEFTVNVASGGLMPAPGMAALFAAAAVALLVYRRRA